MKTCIAAFLITIGFTAWGTGDESLLFTGILLVVKLALIMGGGCLLINVLEQEGARYLWTCPRCGRQRRTVGRK